MLTQQDLQAIENIIDKKLDEKLDKRFAEHDAKWDKRLDEKLDTRFKKELRPIKTELKKMRKDMNLIVKLFDDDLHIIRCRVDHLEDYLPFPPQS